MKFEKKYISMRFAIILAVFISIFALVFGKAFKTAVVDQAFWAEVGEVKISDPQPIKPTRGNILSADGQLIASSLPNYRAFLDFRSGNSDKDTAVSNLKDKLWNENIDSLCRGLAEIVPIKTAEEYKAHLETGRQKQSRYWEICPFTRLNFIQFHEIIKLPYLNYKNRNVSGLTFKPDNNRNKPFGSLARRTLGEMYGEKDSARSGLELAYDTILRGKAGMKHRKKVLKNYLDIIDVEPENGGDLITTIDVTMQDICESALKEKLIELDASVGVVVLMEVQTGDVKAIVNLERISEGHYAETRNYALAALWEPGSTFKTASTMVGLDDGYLSPNDLVDTGSGIYMMYGSQMRDHNWHRGGYQTIDLQHVLMVSSNIGISRLIDQHYHSQPAKFVEGLKRIGIGQKLNLPFVGAADPIIRMPNDTTKGRYWSKTTLPWMSIGYETQIPPISTVTFYNAIANGGKMVKPRFVKAVERDGVVTQTFPVEVIKEHICKQQTLKDIQHMLYRVVMDKEGLGKPARAKGFSVSGKTGTAQVSTGGSYKAGRQYLVSFCGYYPSEDPKYTCIVAIRMSGAYPSGGGMAGPVFSKIASRVYNQDATTDLRQAADSTSVFVPDVKVGDVVAEQYVLKNLGISMQLPEAQTPHNILPDLRGMGARDAIFAIESRGMKARVKGRGKVTHQSVEAGTEVQKGQIVTVELKL